MKLVRFSRGDKTAIGKVAGDSVIDLSEIVASDSMRQLLTGWEEYRGAIESAAGPKISLDEVSLLAPVNDPQKMLAIGMNYKKHVDEALELGIAVPDSQLWFNKQVSCINGPFSDVMHPPETEQLDYEGELAFVIGKRCRRISEDDAMSVIAGFMVANDVSTRDWQRRSQTMTLGKSFDTHGPIGPWIVTPDEIPDPGNLDIRSIVNGELRQSANTGDLLHGIAAQIAYLSIVMTLEPGDVILTGTPAGVGVAMGKFLQPGDVVRIEIDKVGAIENRVVAESVVTA